MQACRRSFSTFHTALKKQRVPSVDDLEVPPGYKQT